MKKSTLKKSTLKQSTLLFGLVPALLFSLAACDKNQGEDTLGGCDDASSPIAGDESSPLGFAPSELLDNVAKTYEDTMVWEDGTTTALTLTVTYTDGDMFFVDSEPSQDTNGTDLAAICDDRLEIGVTVEFQTADGAFDESWDLKLISLVSNEASINQELDLDGLSGSYSLRALNPADYDEVKAWVTATLTSDGSQGEVSEQGSKVEGETASATMGVAGAWPTFPENQ